MSVSATLAFLLLWWLNHLLLQCCLLAGDLRR